MDPWKRCLHLLTIPAVLAALSGCQAGAPAPSSSEQLYATATVARGSMADVVQAAGQVVSQDARLLSFPTVGGRVVEVKVKPGQAVNNGQLLARLDTADQDRQLRQALADLKVNEATLAVAQRGAIPAEIAKAEADLASAEYELANAGLRLAMAHQYGIEALEDALHDAQLALRNTQDQLRLKEMETAVATMRSLSYTQAFYQRQLRDLKPDQDRTKLETSLAAADRDLAAARAAHDDTVSRAAEDVTKAQDQVDKAQAALDRARVGIDQPEAAARLAYEQAMTNAAKARLKVAELQRGVSSSAIQAAQRAYEGTVARVESIQAIIASARLTAPFDGVVFAIYVRVDDRIKARDRVAYVADVRDLRVRAQASELDVANLSAGQPARLTFDAYPGKIFPGELLAVSTRGKDIGGLAIFEIEASLSYQNVDLRPGMLANLRVVVGEKPDVLTIPAAAVQYRLPTQPYVNVRAENGEIREQDVQIGLNDGIMAEVQAGLSEGQTILIPLTPPMDQPRSAQTAVPTAVSPKPASGGKP